MMENSNSEKPAAYKELIVSNLQSTSLVRSNMPTDERTCDHNTDHDFCQKKK